LLPLEAEGEVILEVELLPFVHSKDSAGKPFWSHRKLPGSQAAAL
jgi:hypothetical protein